MLSETNRNVQLLRNVPASFLVMCRAPLAVPDGHVRMDVFDRTDEFLTLQSCLVLISLVCTLLACSLAFVWSNTKTVRHAQKRWWEEPVEAQVKRKPASMGPCPACHQPNPLQKCGRCKAVSYCGRECQVAHWKLHKQHCKVQTAPEEDEMAPIPQQVLYPYGQFLSLMGPPDSSAAPVGLTNCGNTCFANALLQCLLNTQPLVAYLRFGNHSESCSKPSARAWCLMCEMQRLAEQVWFAQDQGVAVVSPRAITQGVRNIAAHFTPGQQEDSHDLYLAMLEQMEHVLLHQAGATRHRVPDLRSRQTTFIGHCFMGYVCYQTVCTSCSWVSQRFDTKVALEVDVSPRTPTIESSLAAGFADEQLDEDNKYKCDRCRQAVCATRHSCVEVAPNVLVLCLKRFGLGRYSKNNRHVAYGPTLDLEPLKAEGCTDRIPARYRLYGVLVHVDVMNSTAYGHYIAYVQLPDGRWFLCDDERVIEVPASQALSQKAYMLFYQRLEPRAIPTSTPRKAHPTGQAAPARRRRHSLITPLTAAANDHAYSNGHAHTAMANGNGHHTTTNGHAYPAADSHATAALRVVTNHQQLSQNNGRCASFESGHSEVVSASSGHGDSPVKNSHRQASHDASLSASASTSHGGLDTSSAPSLSSRRSLSACARVHVWPTTLPEQVEFAGETLPGDQVHMPVPSWRLSSSPASALGTQPSTSPTAASTTTLDTTHSMEPTQATGASTHHQTLATDHTPSVVDAVSALGEMAVPVGAWPLTLYVNLPGVATAADVRVAILGSQLLVWVPHRYLLPLVLPCLHPTSPKAGITHNPDNQLLLSHNAAISSLSAADDITDSMQSSQMQPEGGSDGSASCGVSHAPVGCCKFRVPSGQLKISLELVKDRVLFEAGQWGAHADDSSKVAELSRL